MQSASISCGYSPVCYLFLYSGLMHINGCLYLSSKCIGSNILYVSHNHCEYFLKKKRHPAVIVKFEMCQYLQSNPNVCLQKKLDHQSKIQMKVLVVSARSHLGLLLLMWHYMIKKPYYEARFSVYN